MSRRVNIAVAAWSLAGLACFAQSVISARAGLISYLEGRVLLNDRAVRLVPGRFPQMRTDDVFRCTRGRAEILLNPGAFLRIRENSAVRLLSNSLTEPRFEVLSGAVILEVEELGNAMSVTTAWRGVSISTAKKGLFRLDTNPAVLRVYEGEAVVASEGRSIRVGKGKVLAFGGTWTCAKFDPRQVDSFDQWSGRRTVLVARANLRGWWSARGLMRRGRYSGLYAASSPSPPDGGIPAGVEGTQ